MSPETLLMLARPISPESGPGWFMRGVIIAVLVFVVLVIWAVIRASRGNDR